MLTINHLTVCHMSEEWRYLLLALCPLSKPLPARSFDFIFQLQKMDRQNLQSIQEGNAFCSYRDIFIGMSYEAQTRANQRGWKEIRINE